MRWTFLPLMLILAGCSAQQPEEKTSEASAVAEQASAEAPATETTVLSDAKPGVFVHLFEWSWPAIANECENLLAPAGYSAVQISPPQEHTTGPQWYVRYQPVSYQLVSHSGDREQFIDMVDRCKAVGVDIYVDAVINHMTGVRPEGVGTAGSNYGEYDYPPVYNKDDFNYCGRNENNDIADYNDKWEVQYCELVNLADLKTSSEKVRTTIAAYLNDLLDLGVAGFRIDAAKHMPVEDVAAILEKVDRPYYLFQEVLAGDSSVMSREEYAELGAVTEFQYEGLLGDAFRHDQFDKLARFNSQDGMIPSKESVVFVDNHDSQRGNHALTFKDGDAYGLANIFMLAHPYGYPKVMSSYEFEDYAVGPPKVEASLTGECGNGWVCEHREPQILAMVKFRNATQGSALTQWQQQGRVVSFSREDAGHMVLNASDSEQNLSISTDLADGMYCNILADSCDDNMVQVEAGMITADLASMSAIALLASN